MDGCGDACCCGIMDIDYLFNFLEREGAGAGEEERRLVNIGVTL